MRSIEVPIEIEKQKTYQEKEITERKKFDAILSCNLNSNDTYYINSILLKLFSDNIKSNNYNDDEKQ